MNLPQLLSDTGALMEGHFQLSSGLHSDRYVQCARLLSDPATAIDLGHALGERMADAGPELIVAPALGGMVIGFTTALALEIPMIFTERKEGEMRLRRGFTIPAGARAAIVEDVVTTGKSTRETIGVVADEGGSTVVVGSILNRSGVTNPFEQPYHALEELSVDSWSPNACPLCERGIAIESPGSRFRSR